VSSCQDRAKELIFRLKEDIKRNPYGLNPLSPPEDVHHLGRGEVTEILANMEADEVRAEREAPKPKKMFRVDELSTHFEVVHLPSGKSHEMGDGVDVDLGSDLPPGADESSRAPLTVGMEGFREAWEKWLNEDQGETLAAYFPELAALDYPEEESIESWDRLKKEYGLKLQKLAEQVRDELRKGGSLFGRVSEPNEIDYDRYEWLVTIHEDAGIEGSDDIDISFTLLPEQDRMNEPNWNVTFELGIVKRGGEIIGCFNPHNHTDKCWVDARSEEQVKERWAEFERGCDPAEIVAVVKKHMREQELEAR
jgi:hypothetical protein